MGAVPVSPKFEIKHLIKSEVLRSQISFLHGKIRPAAVENLNYLYQLLNLEFSLSIYIS